MPPRTSAPTLLGSGTWDRPRCLEEEEREDRDLLEEADTWAVEAQGQREWLWG